MILADWIVHPADCRMITDAVTHVICELPDLRSAERRVAAATSDLALGLLPASRAGLRASHNRWRSALYLHCPPGEVSSKDAAVVRCLADSLKEREVRLAEMKRPLYGVRRYPVTNSNGSIEWEAVEGNSTLARALTLATRFVTPPRLVQGRYEVELNSSTVITSLPAGLLEVRNTTLYSDIGRAWVDSYSRQQYILAKDAHVLAFSEVFPLQHRSSLHSLVRRKLVAALGDAKQCLEEVPSRDIAARIDDFANYRFLPSKEFEIEFKFPSGCPNPAVMLGKAQLVPLLSRAGRRYFGF